MVYSASRPGTYSYAAALMPTRQSRCPACESDWSDPDEGMQPDCPRCQQEADRYELGVKAEIDRDIDAMYQVEASYRSLTDERADYDDSEAPF